MEDAIGDVAAGEHGELTGDRERRSHNESAPFDSFLINTEPLMHAEFAKRYNAPAGVTDSARCRAMEKKASSDLCDEGWKIRFASAQDARRHEISLFWQRSLFFWGFISVAFAGFLTTKGKDDFLALLTTCFGLVCAVVWTLANRGSKYWYENWETKVEEAEEYVTGPLYGVTPPVHDRGWWLSARRFSVSKLTIALSDFAALLWSVLFASQIFAIWKNPAIARWITTSVAAVTIGFIILLFRSARSGTARDELRLAPSKGAEAKRDTTGQINPLP